MHRAIELGRGCLRRQQLTFGIGQRSLATAAVGRKGKNASAELQNSAKLLDLPSGDGRALDDALSPCRHILRLSGWCLSQ